MNGVITVGRVGGLFGNRGGLSLILFDTFPRDLNQEEPVFVGIDGHAVPLFFRSFRRRGQRGATAEFEDIDTDNRAAELVGLELSMRTGSRAGRGAQSGAGNADEAGNAGDHTTGAHNTHAGDADELFFEDLVGWEAEVGDGCVGRITEFFDSELNPLLEVELHDSRGGDGPSGHGNAATETVLIPAQDEFIVGIDETRRRVVFDLPEGLLDLNK